MAVFRLTVWTLRFWVWKSMVFTTLGRKVYNFFGGAQKSAQIWWKGACWFAGSSGESETAPSSSEPQLPWWLSRSECRECG